MRVVLVRRLKHDRSSCVPGCMNRLKPESGKRDLGPVSELSYVVGLGEARGTTSEALQEQPSLLSHRPQWICQQHPVLSMHPAA
jgi:hypothetical protein